MRRLAGALLLVALAACGKSKHAAPTDAVPVAAVVVDAAPTAEVEYPLPPPPDESPWWSQRPESALRVLGAALEQLSADETKTWLEQRKQPRPEGEPLEAPPPSVRAAIDALIAWDGSGAIAPVPCAVDPRHSISLQLMYVTRAALELASGPNDAPAHAALRMGLALRADDNDTLAMLVGAAVLKDAVETFERRAITAPVPATFALAPDLPWRVVAANARCVSATLDAMQMTADMAEGFRRMGHVPEKALADEKAAVRAFWDETMRQVSGARTREQLLRVLEQRTVDAAQSRSRSFFVPVLGPPHSAKQLLRDDESTADSHEP